MNLPTARFQTLNLLILQYELQSKIQGIREAYRENTLSRACVFEWHKTLQKEESIWKIMNDLAIW